MKSKSRNVNGYVKAVAKATKLRDKLYAREEKLAPLRSKLEAAKNDVSIRYAKLTGGQIAEARRLTTAPPEMVGEVPTRRAKAFKKLAEVLTREDFGQPAPDEIAP